MQRAKEEPSPVWTLEDRLRKSAQDLVDTERDYVRVSKTSQLALSSLHFLSFVFERF